jgi:hypothetical protein
MAGDDRDGFLIVGSASDLAEEHNFDDYIGLSPIAARHAALFTLGLVQNLPRNSPRRDTESDQVNFVRFELFFDESTARTRRGKNPRLDDWLNLSDCPMAQEPQLFGEFLVRLA